MRPKAHIRVEIAPGAWARVSPDIQPETVTALRRMVEEARVQFSEGRIARLTDEVDELDGGR